MINRAALILKAKKPFVQWINESDPYDKSFRTSLAEVNEDRTVYLIDDLEAENLEEWVALNCANLFESELEDWYTDESLWPQNRDLKLFKNLINANQVQKWFAIECHTVLIDAGTGPSSDDEA
ncbi:MAG: hypothetical protein A2521_03340 [Deltaproteobacteria bacterium RIFOXYD12_FULL_57_12]|nr:MAG: hypothetical protein A2521_03340 [Deltaproteobacteria bacterium RIFOXYD12_FULL_57_12]